MEFAGTLNLTDVRTSWVFTHSMGNRAYGPFLAALDAVVSGIPFEVTGLERRQRQRPPGRSSSRGPVRTEGPGHGRVE